MPSVDCTAHNPATGIEVEISGASIALTSPCCPRPMSRSDSWCRFNDCSTRVCSAPATPSHFVPASRSARYPVDLGYNFVLADSRCNSQKRDRLPACDHLALWTERNAQFGTEITSELERRGVITELASSNRVTRWAYSQTEGAATWLDLIQPFSEM